jgi:ASPIC and UnbV
VRIFRLALAILFVACSGRCVALSGAPIAGGGSYLSQSDLRANFGLGDAALAFTVEVTWPSGGRQVFHDVKADQFYLIEEGRAEMRLQQIRGGTKVSVGTFKN